ncbi:MULTISPECIES: IclR family transcriptional regulator C-terminal domain-containing protein [unclassified Rhodococcus (in: high G+C Gram-positive bacteria)]|uniref:IclR family transcriptional regulator n=1 Tax=unclassified Rhodococcus (in: high G+C Gram-positive bacteria) TaxID=192944 RepID=UPI00163A6D8D|nr:MULTISPECIES: helix-turn-helix domain-containing protein [unclassified Rhodococcus (in: high G+C Gram-positive bacteria)]MBC2637636.1 helix-turn-helix domain-containing protein [Rhodococcus sp. 3A]
MLLTEVRDQGGIRLSDAATVLGVAESTAHRLLSTLAYHGFISQEPDRRYVAGAQMGIEPALAGTQRALRAACQPELDRITRATNETANVMVRTGTLSRTIASVESTRLLRIGSRLGHVTEAHRAAGGRVMLAELDSASLHALDVESPFPEGFAELLAVVRARGYATSINEVEDGLSSIAVAIHLDDEAIGALVLLLPSSRFPFGSEARLVKHLATSVERIEGALRRGGPELVVDRRRS